MGKLGHVAIDSTRIAANASRSATDNLEKLRAERARIRRHIRRWQLQCANEDPNEGAGLQVARAAMERLQGQPRDIPARLERLKKSGMRQLSRTDTDSRFLPDRRGFTLGYTATLHEAPLLPTPQLQLPHRLGGRTHSCPSESIT